MNTLSKIESAMPLPVTVDDILAARVRISGAVVHTPTLISQTLSDMLGCKVYLKFENLQFTAAYKERGALNRLLQLDAAAKEKGVIAASAGNHAQGLAYHGRRLGVPVTIVMPVTTPTVKVTQTQGHGATVVLHGEKFDDASTYARQLAKEHGLTFVHPFDEPDIMAGQGTVALEMLEDAPEIDTLVIPIGGGGLFSGMATAAKAMKPDIRIYGVQAELYPSMYSHIKQTNLACDGDTLAEGIAVKQPGELTRRFVERLADDVLLVDERHLEEALSLLLQIEKTVVEGAGAAGLAALLTHKELFAGRNVGLVLTGGNIDPRLLANVLLRDLARSGRLARLRIILQDRPGALFHVARIFDQEAVNILELSHQRIFTNLPAKGLSLDVECETRDGEHLDRLITALKAAGYEVAPIEVA
ncbi:threonine ammonia-lyase [Sphingomonadales bacterium 56]|jgi:threonine dehydratase|uniref:Threonine ammonia-lyase n=1 Tax=Sphingobium agri TaxID=2933566 RepID=A0ABT0DX68_9SPHN|nr:MULTISPECIES: threonine ammonia-lyase [Sphingobium]MBY2927544.1 threonine ammonia-lyase [Sphingomonadales bacterium 56]MBY2957644.1 threonine ammonia-lyase [Sphingomonadales bacterium 58]MCK0531714.1 threonine ammonia-lyase [Sphingobium agri]CAD7335440.1 L-threonine ammonia-lyase [Sphingobium sp. S6]CAD7335505.1 L-threonine ammonia-lyase [Sphingobium sp. S8]